MKILKPKFIKDNSPEKNLEIWDRYLDEKYVYIIDKLLFCARFRNFPNILDTVFTNLEISKEGRNFEVTFDFFDAPKNSFTNTDIDILIKNKIKNFYNKLKENNFILEIFPSYSTHHSFLSNSLINQSENIDRGNYLTNIIIKSLMTKELADLRSETTSFIVKVIMKEIRYKIGNVQESEVNFGLLEFIQRIDLLTLMKPHVKSLNLSMEEFNIFYIINREVINKVESLFMEFFENNEVSYFKFVMSSKPYIKYSVKFKVGDFYKDIDK